MHKSRIIKSFRIIVNNFLNTISFFRNKYHVSDRNLAILGVLLTLLFGIISIIPILNDKSEEKDRILVQKMEQIMAGSSNNGSIPSQDIGIAGWINIGENIDLGLARKLFNTIEFKDTNGILGTYSFYPSNNKESVETINLYINRNGFIVAYYQDNQPASRTLLWDDDNIPHNKFVSVLAAVARSLGHKINLGNIKFYDYRFPNANKILIAFQSVGEGNVRGYDYGILHFNIPKDLIVYEVSYSLYLNGPYSEEKHFAGEGNIMIDNNVLYAPNTSGIIFDFYRSDISKDIEHDLGVMSIQGTIGTGALVIIYKDSKDDNYNSSTIEVKGPEAKRWDGLLEPIGQIVSTSTASSTQTSATTTLASTAIPTTPKAKVSERFIVQSDPSSVIQGSQIVSPDGKRVAYVAQAGNKMLVVVDGNEEKQYDSIGDLIFSPDSKRIAYVAQAGNKMFVVVDGIDGKQYDGTGALIFSSDSKRVAYVAQAGNKQFVVVDGNEEKQYDGIGITPTPIFSPDSERVAYIAIAGNKRFVVVDGNEEKQYDGTGALIFSPDSKRVAYMAIAGNKAFVVVDGIEGKQYDGVFLNIIFSPDNKQVAYVALAGNKTFVVVDGNEEKQYDGIGENSLIFSPDNKRIAYVAQAGNKMFVVVDGNEEKHYDGIGEKSPIFSPDSKRIAYMAGAGNKKFVVVDGIEARQYDGTGDIIFSPDSKRVAYMAIAGNKTFVVVDGNEEKQYDGIGENSLIFSPDNKRIAYVAQAGNKMFVVVDRNEEKQYDDIITIGERRIVFDSPNSLHYLALKGNSIYFVEENMY